MPATVIVRPARRRRRGKARPPLCARRVVRRGPLFGRARRWVVLLALVLVLVALGTYYSTQYLRDQEYARYPLKYQDEIARYANEYSLGQAHVAAVVLCESRFNPKAVSSEGAMGLMQIMPDTGTWIAGKLGVENFDVNDLFDPDTNLRFGCWYLRWLLDRYGEDKKLTTAAYHAGQGNVDKWLTNPAYSADGRTLTDIPFADTENYTGKVLAAYEKYQKLYGLGA